VAQASRLSGGVFFIWSKVLGFLALPSNVLVILGLAGLALTLMRFRRTGRWIVASAIILFAIAGIGPLGKALLKPLEERFPPWDPAHGSPTGIVVLGGAIDPDFAALHSPGLNENADRVAVIPALAKAYPQARIVFSGGNARLGSRGPSEAAFARALLESFGVAKDRLVLEERSRTTAENAVYAKETAAPKSGETWLLVTSAYHMPRAIGAFRRAGFAVEPYPVDYRAPGRLKASSIDDAASGLHRTDIAAHEWLGLLAYWLTGRSSALFPGPGDR
jgi:uncharacterized SAM-binding protein YcdF (DUF218 family)